MGNGWGTVSIAGCMRELRRLAKQLGRDAFVVCIVAYAAIVAFGAASAWAFWSGALVLAIYLSYCWRQRSVERYNLELRRLALDEKLAGIRETKCAGRAKLSPQQPKLPLGGTQKTEDRS